MNKIIVTTGFGYFTDAAGRTVSKAELPQGEHPISDGFTYGEVADKAALDAIEIYVDPAVVEKADNEIKIQKRIRRTAIDQLKADGELPADFIE